MISRFFPAAFLIMTLLTAASCEGHEKIKFEKAALSLEGAAGPVALDAEIARTEAQRSRGLMFRKTVADGTGMLFIFDRDEVLSFWMKDTSVPLSIAFIAADGRLLEIRDMEPLSLAPVRSSRSVRYALEVPQGWFTRVGIGPGDRLVLEAKPSVW